MFLSAIKVKCVSISSPGRSSKQDPGRFPLSGSAVLELGRRECRRLHGKRLMARPGNGLLHFCLNYIGQNLFTEMQGSLGNVVLLCAQEENKSLMTTSHVPFPQGGFLLPPGHISQVKAPVLLCFSLLWSTCYNCSFTLVCVIIWLKSVSLTTG